jgi:hypothetical protein
MLKFLIVNLLVDHDKFFGGGFLLHRMTDGHAVRFSQCTKYLILLVMRIQETLVSPMVHKGQTLPNANIMAILLQELLTIRSSLLYLFSFCLYFI